MEEVIKPCVELVLDAIGTEFREQGRVPDCFECSRYVWIDGPDLMSDIEGLTLLMIGSKLIGLSCKRSVFAPIKPQ